MKVFVNNTEVTLPTSLSEITLGQRIAYHQQYGADLDKMAASILNMPDGLEKELEIVEFHFEKMFRTFAFFTGTTVDSLKESKFIDDIATIYHASLATLVEDEESMEPQYEFTWKGEVWTIHPPELMNGSQMKFGAFIDSKQVVKDMAELGRGKWEYMLPLCAIFLQKKGEEYTEDMLYEGSDRLKLMEDLPMDIAAQVGFFLTDTLNFYISTLRSSGSPEPKEEDRIPKSTTTVTAG